MRLYPYQIEYLKNLPKNVIMAADVGTGKTVMALHHAWLHNDNLHIVVVAPASKVRTGDWQREIQNYFGENEPLYEVVSYAMFSKKWRELVYSNTTLIIDEAHMACNATTQRGKAVIRASKIVHQWIMLSATPLPNGWRSAETYAIITGLVRNKTEFLNRFVIIDRSHGFPLLLGYRDQESLRSWWATISSPLERTGALKLPSRSIAQPITLPPRLLQTYQTVKRSRLYGDEPLDSAPKLFNRLRQITTPGRIDTVRSILDATDEHIVIFYNYNVEREALLELLAKHYKERPVFEQSGHRSDLPKRDIWDNMPQSVTLAQYQSASQAIELTYASVTIYLSPTYSYALWEQSLGRTRRNGQAKTALFYCLSVEQSVDKEVWQCLKNKTDFKPLEYVDKL